MDGDYHYVAEVAVCLTRDTPRQPAATVGLRFYPSDSVGVFYAWHFRGGTIQLFATDENEY